MLSLKVSFTHPVPAKAITKQDGPKNFLAALNMVSFFSTAICKKVTIFDAARKYFGPSCYVTAL